MNISQAVKFKHGLVNNGGWILLMCLFKHRPNLWFLFELWCGYQLTFCVLCVGGNETVKRREREETEERKNERHIKEKHKKQRRENVYQERERERRKDWETTIEEVEQERDIKGHTERWIKGETTKEEKKCRGRKRERDNGARDVGLIPILSISSSGEKKKLKSFAAVCSQTNEQFGAHLIPSYYNV